MEAIGAVFEGSDIAREQDFGDLEVTYEAEAEETGEVFSVTEDANVLFKQAVKRSDNLQKLRECVSG